MDKNNIKNLTSWERLQIARHNKRPDGEFYIDTIFDKFIEFHGDRYYGDDKAIIGGIGLLGDIPVTIITTSKGMNIKKRIEQNFGMPHPEGYRKALRLMKQAEKFNRPVICFINTPGAAIGLEAEKRGQGEAISSNILEMLQLKIPIISIIIGEAGSGGALALLIADKILMLENSIYSNISPEGFANILWNDESRVQEATEIMKLTSIDLKKYNIIDRIIEEPCNGAHKDPYKMAKNIKSYILKELNILLEADIDELLIKRLSKFRDI